MIGFLVSTRISSTGMKLTEVDPDQSIMISYMGF
ncbi:hypothetical protein N825_29775 [Skermanella stibiiresistens SB22]|uniref:Uncharacterized protein n=1 Tax=Skermanella stibiiresistens SB22 TaxID=1385369 RepID=W9GUQ8_9PROT|nr:hypothetical protein N825_29775 [Skermanella stibiiresistens SB22]